MQMPLSAEMNHLYQAVFRDLKNGQVQGKRKKKKNPCLNGGPSQKIHSSNCAARQL